jgi:hypothetical protein
MWAHDMRNFTVPLKDLLVRTWLSFLFNFMFHVEDNNFTACDTPGFLHIRFFQVTSLSFHWFWSSVSSQDNKITMAACIQNSNPPKRLCLKCLNWQSAWKRLSPHTLYKTIIAEISKIWYWTVPVLISLYQPPPPPGPSGWQSYLSPGRWSHRCGVGRRGGGLSLPGGNGFLLMNTRGPELSVEEPELITEAAGRECNAGRSPGAVT